MRQNVNTAIVLVGFASLLTGIASLWSAAVAAIVGGTVLMAAGSWPYLVRTWRLR